MKNPCCSLTCNTYICSDCCNVIAQRRSSYETDLRAVEHSYGRKLMEAFNGLVQFLSVRMLLQASFFVKLEPALLE